MRGYRELYRRLSGIIEIEIESSQETSKQNGRRPTGEGKGKIWVDVRPWRSKSKKSPVRKTLAWSQPTFFLVCEEGPRESGTKGSGSQLREPGMSRIRQVK